MENSLILNRYQVIETAGEGGYGTVLHAYDTRLKREVAIKTVSLIGPGNNSAPGTQDLSGQTAGVPGAATIASAEAGMIPGLDEARAAGKLSSPNIVTIYDCVVENGVAYVIEEYVEGVTLTRLLKLLKDEINLDIIAHIFKSISTAIMTAHQSNILHLDIKPDNVLIGRGGDVKVADFGLATLMDINGEGSANAGTIGYMPREQMKKLPLDVRSDEWSLAMITYEMLTGSNPFVGAQSPAQAEILMDNSELVVPSVCWEDLPDKVDDVIFKALNVDQEDRYPTVKAFYDALKPLLGDTKVGKRELAVLVNGNAENMVDTQTVAVDESTEEYRAIGPLVDRIGSTGAKVIARILSCIAVAIISAVAFLNMNLTFDNKELALAITIGACTLACAIKPKIGLFASLLLMVGMLFYVGAWMPAAALLLLGVLWSIFIGNNSKSSVFCVLMEPLFGAVGFAPVVPAITGAVSNVRCSVFATLFAGLLAIVFATLGSGDVFNWDVMTHGLQSAQANFIGEKINNAFLTVIQNPATWIAIASWVVSATLFSLFCNKGSRAFDIAGAIICAIILVAGSFATWPEVNVMHVVASVVGGIVAILLAAVALTDRIRMEEGLW